MNKHTCTSEHLLASLTGAATLKYDPLGRLLETMGTGTNGVTTRYGYNGDSLIAEYDGAGTLLRRYVHGPGADAPLVWYDSADLTKRRWLIPDERGSIVVVTDGTGAAIAVNSYDPYGVPALTNLGRFQYTGQTRIPELGMYNYKARIYSATLGRFMQTDPIGYGDGMNMYAYVGNDPVNKVDPTGLATLCQAGIGCWDDGLSENVVEGGGGGGGGGFGGWGGFGGGGGFGGWGGFGGDGGIYGGGGGLLPPLPPEITTPPQKTLPCSAANSAGRGLRVTLGFTNTPVPGTSHAFVVATDLSTGARFASRAGPWSGPGGGSAPDITAVSGAYGPGFPDYGATTGSLGVGNLNVSFEQAASYMQAFAQTTNNNHLAYGGVVQNSNSYAAALLKGMGFTPPSTGRVTPGYNSNPVDPSMVCH